MNESTETENSNKRSWSSLSSIRKGQIIGALTGALATVAMCIPALLTHPHLLDFSGVLSLLTMVPGVSLARVFGKSGQSFLNAVYSSSTALTVFVLVVNSFLGLLAGSLIGWFGKIICHKRKL